MRLGRNSMRWVMLAGLALCAGGSQVQAESPISHWEGRPEVVWQDAGEVVGKVALVSGKVIGVGASKTMRFIDFDENKPARFQVVVNEKHWSAFPGEFDALYKDKIVRVRGMVTTYQERPQIQVTSPDQIEILTELPTLRPVEPRGWTGGEVTIATYNILNLFDGVDDLYHADEGTTPKPREQLQRVADTIRKLNPDVIGFQEVESRGYLERFLEVYLPEMGYDHVVHFEGNDDRGIDVCLASRIPVGPVTSYRHVSFPGPDGRPQRFERDLLMATIEPPGGEPFEVWVVHLKSNFGGREFAEGKRVAEAMKVRKVVDDRLKKDPGARFILLGDFNDTWESTTMKSIAGSGPTALVFGGEKVLAEGKYTYNQRPYLTMIDFILASPAMGSRLVQDSYGVEMGSIESSGSDHNPVMARFRVK